MRLTLWRATHMTTARLRNAFRDLRALRRRGRTSRSANAIAPQVSRIGPISANTLSVTERMFATLARVTHESLITSREEIEGLRRSLTMGNGLPSDQIRRLLVTCEALLAASRGRAARDVRLREELDALRPLIIDVRARLRVLHHELNACTERDSDGASSPA